MTATVARVSMATASSSKIALVPEAVALCRWCSAACCRRKAMCDSSVMAASLRLNLIVGVSQGIRLSHHRLAHAQSLGRLVRQRKKNSGCRKRLDAQRIGDFSRRIGAELGAVIGIRTQVEAVLTQRFQ